MVATPARIRTLEPPGRGSHEEYHPYRTTASWTGDTATVLQKQCRYTGLERGDETGLQCHGVQCRATWLGIDVWRDILSGEAFQGVLYSGTTPAQRWLPVCAIHQGGPWRHGINVNPA